MDSNVKTLFAFDEQGNIVFQADSLELPVVYHPAPSGDIVVHQNPVLIPIAQATEVAPYAQPMLGDGITRVGEDLARTTRRVAAQSLQSLINRGTVLSGKAPALTSRVRDYFRYTGPVRLLGNGLILAGVLGLAVSFYPILSSQIGYYSKHLFGDKNATEVSANSGLAPLITQKPKVELPALAKTPVNTNFGIVIDKIDVNAPIVGDVNSADYNDYMNALKKGAAHAKGTATPGHKTEDGNGNTFIFAHSTLNLWEVPKYNAIFILLNKVEVGDRISTFYKGLRYDYIVSEKKIVEADDVKYLTTPSDDQILTLQTCDPPGTNLRRLIVTAKLVNEEGVEIH